jgi:hypothetical protein
MKTKFTKRFYSLVKSAYAFCAMGLMSLAATDTFAQYPASSYQFTAVSSTFTEITGSATNITAIQTDDGTSASLPIGFTFNYCGTNYTDFRMCSNGWLSFNAATTSTTITNSEANLATIKPALMPLWDDLSGAVGTAQYQVSGTAPNRVLTVECKDWRWNYSSSYPATISFQIKLYETTNIIEYIYRQETGTGNTAASSGATIGIGDGAATPTYLVLENSSATPPVSSTNFVTNITTRPQTGQLYRFAPPQPCNVVTGLPTAGTATASPTSLCLTGNVTLSTTPATSLPATTGITYTWERSVNGGTTWTTEGTSTIPTFMTTTPVTVNNTIFRVKMMCGTSVVYTSSNTAPIVVNNPGTATATGGTRCGPGSVTLNAVAPASAPNITWYAAATGGAPLGTGTSFNTPYITNTSTFYAAAGSAATAPSVPTWVGTGTTSNTTPNPYYTTYWGTKNQFLIRASELIAAGLSAGSIGFQTTGSFAMNLTNFEIKMGMSPLTTMPAAYQTGLTTVYTSASYTPTLGNNIHLLTTPFIWDGTSSIIIETCFNNSSWSGGFSAVGTTLSYNASYYGYADVATVCSAGPANSYTSTFRPNIRFEIESSCQGPRVPAVATVTSGSAVTKSSQPVVCNNTITPITVTLPTNGQYTPYKFYPVTNLYTDAAATVPYTGTAATTVYFKSATSGQHTVYAIGGDTSALGASTGCSRADTFNIWVQPAGNTIFAMPDTICVSGDSKMTLQTDTNFAPGSLTWQHSLDGGATYSTISGASFATFTTPTISTDRKYRVLVNAGSNLCYTVNKDILVVDPLITNIQGGEHCGPGSVTLSAVPGPNASIKWYQNAAGGLPIAQGNVFNTPVINNTTTYYVTSGSGGSSNGPTWVGTGTTSTTGTPGPFYTGWYGSKNQYLFRASELLAAGISPGTITEIGFDVTTSTGLPLTGFNMSMGATTATTVTTTWETGLTQVYSTPVYNPTANTVNVFVLQTPFVWDGVSNIIIETCFNNTSYSGSHGVRTHTASFTGSHYYYADNATVCTIGGTGYTTSTRPNVRFEVISGCETPRQAVVATINPLPIVDLGNDLDTCVDQGLAFTVDAAPQPNNATYMWDNGATTSTRSIDQSGQYYVAVTNQFGCVGHDTLNIAIKDNPKVDLAAGGINLCIGGTKVLDAGPDGQNGGSYYWSTGATSQTITVNSGGTYIAYVTSPLGCLKMDTVTIIESGFMPQSDGILSTATGPTSFLFTVASPQNAVEYIWDFGDGSPLQTVNANSGVPHNYTANGQYWVKVNTNSTCGTILDSMLVNIIGVTGINNVKNDINVKVFPNPSFGDIINIETEGDVLISAVKITNILGQQVYQNKSVEKNTKKLQVQLAGHLAAGVYNVLIETSKGVVNRKLEILK